MPIEEYPRRCCNSADSVPTGARWRGGGCPRWFLDEGGVRRLSPEFLDEGGSIVDGAVADRKVRRQGLANGWRGRLCVGWETGRGGRCKELTFGGSARLDLWWVQSRPPLDADAVAYAVGGWWRVTAR